MAAGRRIIDIAKYNGATVAGIADVAALRTAPSHRIYPKMPEYAPGEAFRDDGAEFPAGEQLSLADSAGSLLVAGLAHPRNTPELDWWDGSSTPGNRLLIDILQRTSRQVARELGIQSRQLHYFVERGGVFLKDAAVFAGLGCIGKNNMLITPGHGPRIRLRALLMESLVEPTGPVYFDPCADCPVFCRSACPEGVMVRKAPVFDEIDFDGRLPARDGWYERDSCSARMEQNEDISSPATGSDKKNEVRCCRRCEFACPVGKTEQADSC